MDDVTAVVFIENEKKKINDQYVALLYFKHQKSKTSDTTYETKEDDLDG